MLCKLRTKKCSNKPRETDDDTKESNNIQKTKNACTVVVHDSGCKSSSGQRKEEARKIVGGAIEQGEEQKGVSYLEPQKRGKNSPFCHFHGHLSIQRKKKAELEPKTQKYEGPIVLRGDICER